MCEKIAPIESKQPVKKLFKRFHCKTDKIKQKTGLWHRGVLYGWRIIKTPFLKIYL